MTKVTNFKDISDILCESIEKSKWDKILRTFLRSSEFEKIISYLLQDVEEGNRFTPPVTDILKPFRVCPYQDLKVIFITGEPYNEIGVSNGLAFSTPIGISKELPLKVLHSNIARSVYNNKLNVSDFNTELEVWAEQGVLLLNSALTAVVNKDNRHIELWKPFISYLIDMLNSHNTDIVYVLFGEKAQFFSDLIDDDQNVIVKLDDPGVGFKKWDAKDIFNEINHYLNTIYKTPIVW